MKFLPEPASCAVPSRSLRDRAPRTERQRVQYVLPVLASAEYRAPEVLVALEWLAPYRLRRCSPAVVCVAPRQFFEWPARRVDRYLLHWQSGRWRCRRIDEGNADRLR